MTDIQDIPKPQVLDPHRSLTHEREEMTLEEHRNRARELEGALQDSCAYADQLWERLDGIRHYLVDSLPPQPRSGSRLGGAHPSGPDDEQGWYDWRNAYAAVTSVLAGPKEDMGFGAEEADQIARERLVFSDGSTPTQETIEGTPRPAPVPVPPMPSRALAAGGFAAGLAFGWARGRASGARRVRSG